MPEIEALRTRKRRLDIASFLLTLPYLVAVIQDMFWPAAGGSGLHPWVDRFFVPWIILFGALALVRFYRLRCPRCGKSPRRGVSLDPFRPLPDACENCGLRLVPDAGN